MNRRPWPLAILVIVSLISAGCSTVPADGRSNSNSSSSSGGGGGGGGSSGGSTATTRQQAMAFAQCMRDNGVREFPDPDASGALTIETVANGTSIDTDSPAFQQAVTACKDLQPSGFTGFKRSPEQQQAALKFAQCMRDNGVQDFPDPAPDDPLVDTNRIPSANRSGGMDILNAAMEPCGHYAGEAGVTGP